ncbi:hypothetical protein KH5_02510 [Urechidicola sp. KH5]
MKIFDTVHKRKSAAITTVIAILILILIFFIGLKYMDPPIESGIAVNFGTSTVGSGNVQPTQKVRTEPIPEPPKEEEIAPVEEEPVASEPESAPAEEILTNDTEESIKIDKAEEERKAKEKAENEAKAEAERIAKEKAEAKRKAKEEADRIKKEEAEKRANLDAMMGGLNKSDGTSGGEGDDTIGGDKGKESGDPNAKGYYGNGGNGPGGNYLLGNRKPLETPDPDYECEEEGVVIVSIQVDRKGKVIKATPGVKGTTNTADCLLSKAKEAALKTTWQPDPKAGEKQLGIIKYRFSLRNQ